MKSGLILESTKYYVLLALADGGANGKSIQDQILEDTRGQITILPSTVYSTLKILHRDQMIEKVEMGTDARAAYYLLTSLGLKKLRIANRALEAATQTAHRRL